MKKLALILALTTSLFAQVHVRRNDGISQITAQAQSAATTSAADPTVARAAIVVLSDPSLSESIARVETRGTSHVRDRMFSGEGDTRLASIRQNKAPLIKLIQQRGMNVRSQAEHVINAVMVDATDADLAWLRAQPGVASAEFSGTKHIFLDAATNLIGAQQVWSQIGGADQAGRGIKIAILDSGIDQTHPMFSDSGFSAPSGFPRTNSAAAGTYTNNKVIVAKNYVCPATGTCPGSSTFDKNGSDAVGHGTFVASVAAGRSVSSPLGFTLAGVAPGAYLGSYKVFSSAGSGSDSAIIQAYNDAVLDGFNVINFSGGDASGSPVDATYATLVRNAANANIVTVFAAGNCGPFASSTCTAPFGDNTIGSPAISPDAIAAGASTNSRTLSTALHVLAPTPVPVNLQAIQYNASDTPQLTTTIGPAILVDIVSLDATKQACNAFPAGSFSGKIALVMRGSCNFSVKAINAQNAGAVGVLFYDNVGESLSNISPTTVGPPAPTIPSAIVTQLDGVNLQGFLAAHPGQVQVRLDVTLGPSAQTADMVSGYSSRGPSNDFSVKPDLVAPGDMYAAVQIENRNGELYDASRYGYFSGTSFASPMTAGAAAVLMAQRPTLTARDIKSALVNASMQVTGTQDGATLSVMHTGGGRLNLPTALSTTLVSNPVSLSFGLVNGGTINATKSLTLKNIGSSSETFTVTLTQTTSDSGLTVSTDQTAVPITAGASTTLNLTLATNKTEGGVFEGFINLKSQTGTTAIRIPYWVMFGLPSIPTGGLVDGAAFGKPVAVGGIVSLFGTNLGSVGFNALSLPLPFDLNHTTVYITGVDSSGNSSITQEARQFYSSSGQVNFQLPYTLVPNTDNTTNSLQVLVAGESGNSISFTVSPTAPGIFTSAGTGILVHPDFSLITASSPAAANEVISIYCAGLGAVTPVVQAGLAAPATPLAQAASTTATVGGKAAVVSFSGLTPGFVGLYQVNVAVPTGLATGAQPVTITVGGVTSPTVTTYVK